MRIHDARIDSGPAVEPVGLEEVKANSRIDHNEDDDLIEMMITTAREHCEDVSRWAFITRTYIAKLDCWPYDDCIELPFPPLQSVEAIEYTDEEGNTSTFSASNYVVDSHSIPGRIVLKTNSSWPTVNLQVGGAITISFTAGYGDAAGDVPARYRQAILTYVGAYYENREAFVLQPGLTPITLPFVDQWLMTNRAY